MALKNQANKKKLVTPDLPGGFRDYGPSDAIAKQAMTDTIRTTFERFGFDPLETSAIQRTEVLTGGEEDSGKIIFNVKGSQEKKSDSSLRFDLTVPLARFVADNPDIAKPFKRYEIGRVWRGERQQAGRYREFMQADVDIVGSSSLDADAEIAILIYAVFQNLGLNDFFINYNNRRTLNRLPQIANFPAKRLWEALRIIDKEDKIGIDGVMQELKKSFGAPIANDIKEFIFTMTSKSVNIDDSGEKTEWGKIYEQIESPGLDADKFRAKRSLVRGLSYYTGSVFEVILPEAPELGSVCGGGRYDDLIAQFTGQKIPSVGVSFGIDRLFAAMEKLGSLQKQQTKTQVLILQLDKELKDEYLRMSADLRNAGIATALSIGDDTSFASQLAYAVKKEIPYAVIYGTREKQKGAVTIKNLAAREQNEIPRDQIVSFFKK